MRSTLYWFAVVTLAGDGGSLYRTEAMLSIAGIFADLQRRGVYRVAGIYCVSAWVISEVAISLEGPLGLPDWLDTSIVIVLAMGFPIALLLAYY